MARVTIVGDEDYPPPEDSYYSPPPPDYTAPYDPSPVADALGDVSTQPEDSPVPYDTGVTYTDTGGGTGDIIDRTGRPPADIPPGTPESSTQPVDTRPGPGTPTPPSSPSAPSGPTGYDPNSPNQQYLADLLAKGVDPAEASRQYNQFYKRSTGNEAAYYSDRNVIGLPNGVGGPYGGYFFKDNNGWHFVPRVSAETGGGTATPTPKAPPTGPLAPSNPLSPGTGTGLGGGSGTYDILSQILATLLAPKPDPNAALRSKIGDTALGLIDQYGKPVSANDPQIKAMTDAYHGSTQRNLEGLLSQMAERAHAEGVPTGAFDAATGNARVASGLAEAGYTTGLIGSELSARRAALANILQTSGAFLSDQDKTALQSKIADMDAIIREQGVGNESQSIANQFALGEGSLANQSTSIGNQNTQFYDDLAYRYSKEQNDLNSLLLELGLQ